MWPIYDLSPLTLSGKFPAQEVEELKGRTGKDKMPFVQKEEGGRPGGAGRGWSHSASPRSPWSEKRPASNKLPHESAEIVMREDKQPSRDPGRAEFSAGADVWVRPWFTKPSQALDFKMMMTLCCEYFQRKRKMKSSKFAWNVLSSPQKMSPDVGKGQH